MSLDGDGAVIDSCKFNNLNTLAIACSLVMCT